LRDDASDIDVKAVLQPCVVTSEREPMGHLEAHVAQGRSDHGIEGSGMAPPARDHDIDRAAVSNDRNDHARELGESGPEETSSSGQVACEGIRELPVDDADGPRLRCPIEDPRDSRPYPVIEAPPTLHDVPSDDEPSFARIMLHIERHDSAFRERRRASTRLALHVPRRRARILWPSS